LWVNQPPARAEFVQACGPGAFDTSYRVDVLSGGATICSLPAASLSYVAEDCALNGSLDQYRLRIVQPDYQTAICKVETPDKREPTAREIEAQCPQATTMYEVRFFGEREVKPETVSTCKPPPVAQPASIATSEEYYLLAGKLIWHGLAKSECPGGYSGVDPVTFAATPCGMTGARDEMIAWQNSLDDSILAAAREWNVPADLLKRIIAAETQFWTWTGVDDEHGLAQITDDGAAVVLHVYEAGYYRLTPRQQFSARQAWLRQLDCNYCTPLQGIEHAKRAMPLYAQALAAYYCMYGSWDAAVRAWNINYKIGG
jgi:hypothetical protein